eukprot:SAG31_NODE_22974_length_514_cov_0.742169_1_plen_24_part_10
MFFKNVCQDRRRPGTALPAAGTGI